MPTSSEYYRAKAAQCRRLAYGILHVDDPIRLALLDLAMGFDAMAEAAARKASER